MVIWYIKLMVKCVSVPVFNLPIFAFSVKRALLMLGEACTHGMYVDA